MEDTLIFNSAAFSALDEWVGGGQDTATRAAEQDDHQQHQQHQHHAQHGRWKRAGVGAVTANPKVRDGFGFVVCSGMISGATRRGAFSPYTTGGNRAAGGHGVAAEAGDGAPQQE